jgi:hypothetical protein
VLIDANLAWRASALTTFLLAAQSTFYRLDRRRRQRRPRTPVGI